MRRFKFHCDYFISYSISIRLFFVLSHESKQNLTIICSLFQSTRGMKNGLLSIPFQFRPSLNYVVLVIHCPKVPPLNLLILRLRKSTTKQIVAPPPPPPPRPHTHTFHRGLTIKWISKKGDVKTCWFDNTKWRCS